MKLHEVKEKKREKKENEKWKWKDPEYKQEEK